jgi:hypothetical protein
MPENRLDVRFVQNQLSELVDYYSRPDIGKVEFWELLAIKLSMAMNRNEPWTWRYVQGVYRGTILPSRDFSKAVERLGALIDGVHELSVKTEVINVHVLPSTITPGSFVMGKSKICPKCTIGFVPNVPWRKECPVCSPPK